MEEFILSILEVLGKAWWVEIKTESPKCTYYFGPFVRKRDAAKMKPGYVEDLQGEGAEVVSLEIKRCKPTVLTDLQQEDDDDSINEKFPSFSAQSQRSKSFHE